MLINQLFDFINQLIFVFISIEIQLLYISIAFGFTQSSFLQESIINRSFAPMSNIFLKKSTYPSEQQLETATPSLPQTFQITSLDSYINAHIIIIKFLLLNNINKIYRPKGIALFFMENMHTKSFHLNTVIKGEYIKFQIPVLIQLLENVTQNQRCNRSKQTLFNLQSLIHPRRNSYSRTKNL
ncbi:unnamed protein product [Paramecium sonneborni]|uniref:Transmembrane protein n=1 Tax=Paramecium sonneborni TaxID=65129 RepID=A0A8S1KVQ6_9CILI|nr:unnamed protein product [Paramecium sonneborni]